MAQYISKDALVAETEKELNTTKKYSTEYVNGKKYALKKILSFINTIEVKEVDLKEEIKRYINDNICGYCVPGVEETAKHFFELGVKTRTDKELAEEELVPLHSYSETIYHVGKEPRWKVGDNLAYYMFFNDYEGEYEFGKVTNIGFDKVIEDWLYTFEDGDTCSEEELIREEAYKKVERL